MAPRSSIFVVAGQRTDSEVARTRASQHILVSIAGAILVGRVSAVLRQGAGCLNAAKAAWRA